MNPFALIQTCEMDNVKLFRSREGKLRFVAPPEGIKPTLRATLAEHRHAVLDALGKPEPWNEDEALFHVRGVQLSQERHPDRHKDEERFRRLLSAEERIDDAWNARDMAGVRAATIQWYGIMSEYPQP